MNESLPQAVVDPSSSRAFWQRSANDLIRDVAAEERIPPSDLAGLIAAVKRRGAARPPERMPRSEFDAVIVEALSILGAP